MAWRARPTPQSLANLLKALDPVIDKAVKMYANGRTEFRPYARRLAIKVIQKYSPEAKVKIDTYLLSQLQPLRQEVQYRAHAVRLPANVVREISSIAEDVANLRRELGREPTYDEIADATGLSVKRVKKIMSSGYTQMIPTEGFDTDLDADQLYDEVVSPVNPELMWVDFVYHDLNPIDKKIFEWKTGYRSNEVLPTEEIAKRLNITPSAVTQRATKIDQMLADMPKGVFSD